MHPRLATPSRALTRTVILARWECAWTTDLQPGSQRVPCTLHPVPYEQWLPVEAPTEHCTR